MIVCHINLSPEWALLKSVHVVALKTYMERNTLDAWLTAQVDDFLRVDNTKVDHSPMYTASISN